MEQSYEKSLARLEEITAQLESGGMELEDSLRLFEEGVTIYRTCLRALDRAQGRIEKLSMQVGSLTEQPFEEEEA